jgi:hypothetical protein
MDLTPQQKHSAGIALADRLQEALDAFIVSPNAGGHRRALAELSQKYREACALGKITAPTVYRPRAD